MSSIWIVKDSPEALSLMKKLADNPRPGKIIFLNEDEWRVFIDECHPMPIKLFMEHIDEPRDYRSQTLILDHHFVPFKDRDDLRGTCSVPGCERTDAH